jgi:hypothetical protein
VHFRIQPCVTLQPASSTPRSASPYHTAVSNNIFAYQAARGHRYSQTASVTTRPPRSHPRMTELSTTHNVVRYVALGLIVSLQLSHYILQLLDRWGPPRKPQPKLITLAKLNELGFISITCSRIVAQGLDVKLGKRTIRGLGIEVLLWSVALWSAACVAYDALITPDSLISLAQLMVVDVVMWTDMLSSAVGLVEWKEQAGYETVAGDGKVLVVEEKMEV